MTALSPGYPPLRLPSPLFPFPSLLFPFFFCSFISTPSPDPVFHLFLWLFCLVYIFRLPSIFIIVLLQRAYPLPCFSFPRLSALTRLSLPCPTSPSCSRLAASLVRTTYLTLPSNRFIFTLANWLRGAVTEIGLERLDRKAATERVTIQVYGPSESPSLTTARPHRCPFVWTCVHC